MSEALPEMVITAISQCSNPTKEHLYPRHNWHCLPNNPMTNNCDLPDLSVETFCDVEFEVYPEYHLDDEHQHQPIGKGSVHILCEDPPLMQMPQEICTNRNYSS